MLHDLKYSKHNLGSHDMNFHETTYTIERCSDSDHIIIKLQYIDGEEIFVADKKYSGSTIMSPSFDLTEQLCIMYEELMRKRDAHKDPDLDRDWWLGEYYGISKV